MTGPQGVAPPTPVESLKMRLSISVYDNSMPFREIAQECFEEFLRTYADEDGEQVYWNQIRQMMVNNETSLAVDYTHIVGFESSFESLISEDPLWFLYEVSATSLGLLRRLFSEIVTQF